MNALAILPNSDPDPDCGVCFGEGQPQSIAHQILADDWSNEACPHCWATTKGDADDGA